MRHWQLGILSTAVLVLAACEQKKPEPAAHIATTDKPLTQMDTPPVAATDPYATDPYAHDTMAKPAAKPLGAAAPKKAPAATSEKETTLIPSAKPGARTHVVQKGDTLSSLARKYYGNEKKWKVIWEANKTQVPNKDKLKVGMKLVIP